MIFCRYRRRHPSKNNTSVSYFLMEIECPELPGCVCKGYEGIRAVNVLLKNIHKISLKPRQEPMMLYPLLKAEGRFIRAMCWELVECHLLGITLKIMYNCPETLTKNVLTTLLMSAMPSRIRCAQTRWM